MSRFFEQTKKAQDWAARGVVSSDLDIKRVVEAIHEADSAAPNVPASRFSNARRIHLSSNSQAPLLLQQHVSKALAGESYRALRTRLMRLQIKRGLRSIV